MKGKIITHEEQVFLNKALLDVCIQKNADLSIIQDLISRGADVNAINDYGSTPMHLSCKSGNIDVVRYLLKNKALINIPNKDISFTPMHLACKFGSVDLVELLFKNGAQINTVDIYGDTPFHISCFSRNIGVVKFLLEQGATIYRKSDTNNESILSLISNFNGDIQNILWQHDAKIKKTLEIILSTESMDNLDKPEYLEIANFYEKHLEDLKFIFTKMHQDKNIDEVFGNADSHFQELKLSMCDEILIEDSSLLVSSDDVASLGNVEVENAGS